jgi:cytochrome c-type biogenesis protein CcmF
VRSGVLTSVHAFATDPARGSFILGFLVTVVGGSLMLYALARAGRWAWAALRPASRETLLLANNVLLVAACGAVLLGTLYPLLLDALGLGKISVGPPYFEAVFVPLMAPVVLLMGVGPLARWKQAGGRPGAAAALAGARPAWWRRWPCPWAAGAGAPVSAFGLLLAAWVFTSTRCCCCSARAGKWPPPAGARAAAQLLGHGGGAPGRGRLHRRRDDGQAATRRARREDGASATRHVGRLPLHAARPARAQGPNYVAARGTLEVQREAGASTFTTCAREAPVQGAGHADDRGRDRRGLTRDLYVSLGEMLDEQDLDRARLHKPFVDWIWGGCALMALGGLLAAGDRRYRMRAAAEGRAADAAAGLAGGVGRAS